MIPIVTPEEMAAVDAAAPEPIDELIHRAGTAVAWAARRMLGGTYGRRVVVVAGPGNNGALGSEHDEAHEADSGWDSDSGMDSMDFEESSVEALRKKAL